MHAVAYYDSFHVTTASSQEPPADVGCKCVQQIYATKLNQTLMRPHLARDGFRAKSVFRNLSLGVSVMAGVFIMCLVRHCSINTKTVWHSNLPNFSILSMTRIQEPGSPPFSKNVLKTAQVLSFVSTTSFFSTFVFVTLDPATVSLPPNTPNVWGAVIA